MIVITSLDERPVAVRPGDKFNLAVTDQMGFRVVISEEITAHKTIDFIASFRFALEDGTCPCFHLAGFFGKKAELPKEMREAKKFEDLTDEQRQRFVASVGVRV
jgi:hypothetical protein